MREHIELKKWLGTSSFAYSKRMLVGTPNRYVFADNSTKHYVFLSPRSRDQFQPVNVPPVPGPDLLRSLYAEFAEEDKAMAEEGLSMYAQGLTAIDNE